jgi:hypothetical protein
MADIRQSWWDVRFVAKADFDYREILPFILRDVSGQRANVRTP